MNEFLDYTNNILNELIGSFSGQEFFYPAKMIACLGALVGIFMIYKKSTLTGEPIDANELFRIGGLFFAISFYGTFIQVINVPLNLMTESIKSASVLEYESTIEDFNTYGEIPEESEFVENAEMDAALEAISVEEEIGLIEGMVSNIESSVSGFFEGPGLGEKIQAWFQEAIFSFLHFLSTVAMLVLNIIRSFFLVVLTYFGIFVLAISVFPVMKGSFVQWLQKYINVSLWLPIAYILQTIISRLSANFKPSPILDMTEGSLDKDYHSMIYGLISICAIVAFATIPTMSSWLVNAATSSAGSKLKSKGQSSISTVKASIKPKKGVS